METIIAFDSHKRYTLASVETKDGRLVREDRISYRRGEIVGFLSKCEPGSPVAVETMGAAAYENGICGSAGEAEESGSFGAVQIWLTEGR